MANFIDMQAVLFYTVYPFLYLFASLPIRILYVISDVLYLLLRLSGYRQKVVYQNLRNSFPHKSEKELKSIAEGYFRYMCDLILETFKTIHMNEKDFLKRCTFVSQPFLEKLQRENKSFLIVMGHYGNWEWAGPCFALHNRHQLRVVYRPMSNRYFEKMLCGMRTKYGTQVIPVNNTLRDMVANRHLLTATALLADQTATKKDAYWTTFLNQDTAVFTGPEKLAKKFNYPIVYINITRPKRGYYTVTPELLISEPANTTSGEICDAFTSRLESEILKDPTIWLWSHRRWKHKRDIPVTA